MNYKYRGSILYPSIFSYVAFDFVSHICTGRGALVSGTLNLTYANPIPSFRFWSGR